MKSCPWLPQELELYDPLMLSKPALLVLNKMDLETSPDRMGEFEEALAKGKGVDMEKVLWIIVINLTKIVKRRNKVLQRLE